jgi:hypothetical protein
VTAIDHGQFAGLSQYIREFIPAERFVACVFTPVGVRLIEILQWYL